MVPVNPPCCALWREDKDYIGEIHQSPGYSIGMLEQEPKLDESKTVIEIVREGVQKYVDILNEYEEVNNKFGDEEILNDPDKMDKLINRQALLQEQIDQHDLWNLDNRLRTLNGCSPLSRARCVDKVLSGGERRRVALCRLSYRSPISYC
jgi:energy-dependent translational throttle protein EttA